MIWLPVIYVGLALLEYVAHRWFMHRRNSLTRTEFQRHAVQHHGKRVNQPLYPYIDLPVRYHLLYGSPGWGGFLVGFLLGAPYALGGLLATLLMFVLHAYFYTKLHRAQHDLEDNWTTKMSWFEEMKRHHLDHHKRPSRNFAVVFLWTDKLFGTHWRSVDKSLANE